MGGVARLIYQPRGFGENVVECLLRQGPRTLETGGLK